MTSQSQRTAGQIARDLRALGVRRGGVLLVHSSLSAMGYVAGGPETVILGLLDALGSRGTLMMPALSYEHVTREHPVFDVHKTPSNVGAIPEHFRTRPGTQRSVHPTHSVCALGRLADAMLREHHLDNTPCGPHSPFQKLRQARGQILMLGCGLEPNTSMHAIEEIVNPSYLLDPPFTYTLITADNQREDNVYHPHNFNGWIQRYDRVADILNVPDLRYGRVLEAMAPLIDAQALWRAVLVKLEQNPLAFVERKPRL